MAGQNRTCPYGVWRGHRELTVQQIGCDGQRMFAVGGDDELLLAFGADAVQFHGALYAGFAHADTVGLKRSEHAWPAVLAFDFGVDGANVNQQGVVTWALAGGLCSSRLAALVALLWLR